MPPIDISRIARLLPQFLQENQDVASRALDTVAMANGNGQPDAEDLELTFDEISRWTQAIKAQAVDFRRGLGVLQSQRVSLLGDVENARRILTEQNAGEVTLSQLSEVASQDGNAGRLSLDEVDAWTKQLESLVQRADTVNPFQVEGMARSLAQELEELERTHPEVFLAIDPAARRAPVSLYALSWLDADDWQRLSSLPAPAADEKAADVPPQVQMDRTIAGLLMLAGIDPENPPTNTAGWRLDFTKVEERFNALQSAGGLPYGSAEEMMADVRYMASKVSGAINGALADRILANPSSTASGISLQPLRDVSAGLEDPRAEFFLGQAGPDGILTRPELQSSIDQYYDASASAPTQEDVINDLKLLITAHTPAPEPVEPYNFRREMSYLVLEDLQRMRSGFTHRDRQISLEGGGMFGWGHNLIQGASWVVTLGGKTTHGKLYEDVVRDAVEVGDTRRMVALDQIRELIERPSFEFQDWLRARGADPHSGAIPEALEYLRQTAPEHYQMLTGKFFQAQRLWDIRNIPDARTQALHWLGFAQELRDSHWSGIGKPTAAISLNNLEFARAILVSLVHESHEPDIRAAARYHYQDSIGDEILDVTGRNTIAKANGHFGLDPSLWFGNYSDEARTAFIGDAVLLGGTFLGAGAPLRGFRAVLTQTGRRSLLNGVGRFIGLRSTAAAPMAELTTAEKVAQALRVQTVANEASVNAARAEVTALEATLGQGNAPLWSRTKLSLARGRNGIFNGLNWASNLPSRIIKNKGWIGAVGRGAQWTGKMAFEGLMRTAVVRIPYEHTSLIRPLDPINLEQQDIIHQYRISLPENQISK